MLRVNIDGVENDYCEVPEEDKKDRRVKYLHGHKATGLQEKGNEVVVQYKTNEGKNGEIEADFVLGPDGLSSTVRSILTLDVERTYADTSRCAVLCARTKSLPSRVKRSVSITPFSTPKGIQILAYLIPGENGILEPVKRLNFVYYTNLPSSSLNDPSLEFRDLMTVADSVRSLETEDGGGEEEQLLEMRGDDAINQERSDAHIQDDIDIVSINRNEKD